MANIQMYNLITYKKKKKEDAGKKKSQVMDAPEPEK